MNGTRMAFAMLRSSRNAHIKVSPLSNGKVQMGTNSLNTAIGIAKKVMEAGIGATELSNMLKPLKNTSTKMDNEDVNVSLNEKIHSIMIKAKARLSVATLHESTKELNSLASILRPFGISEQIAKDILLNNPLLLALSKDEIEELCHQLSLAEVDLGDYASILSQHSQICGK
ncbi:hypothetical protein BgAZ_105100 [Babesia gibsoni]|uniref:Uncharacterized protein n=1 Tax=Babesia gibsoni TaxID=33632 RepID=A0AAD8PG00_BABGI|nr:hypothetical protein BgAZ_105100 [Babesia gibsoni]